MPLVPVKRIEGLDGLRALAIAFVILGHVSVSPGVPPSFAPVSWLLSVTDLAGLGVRLFFVLSGFIITHLLLSEELESGKINLLHFWARRCLRILPPLAGYMLAVFVLSQFVPVIHPSPGEYWRAATFTWSTHSTGTWYLGHTWSLSIEEQFYLFWPCAFIAIRARRLQALAFAGLIILPLMTVATQSLMPQQSEWLLPANGCYLAAGCCLAMLRQRYAGWLTRHIAWSRKRLLAIGLMLGFSPVLLLRWSPSLLPVAALPGAAGLAALLHYSIENHGVLKRVLTLKPAVLAGTLSYSLYLWQQVFLGRYGTEWWQRFPQNLLFAGIAAALSHLILERPFMGLRQFFRHSQHRIRDPIFNTGANETPQP